MQKLIMPFAKQMMLCGYKGSEYQKYWGYSHYGIDVSSIQGGAGDDPTVYASGNGTVLCAGLDAKLGYGLAVLYPQALNHKTGEARDLVARYMHLKSISVKAGDNVMAGDPIGVEGKEGTADYHLHLEFDTDAQWPAYSPQVAGSTFWKRGTDSTVNPSFVLHIGEGQALVKPTYNPAWLNPEDFAIPAIVSDYQALYEAERAARAAAEGEAKALREKIEKALEALK